MKPFARINLSSVALRRLIFVSSLALAAVGCCSIERTGEYYVATKTMTFQKLDEYHREIGDPTYMPLPFSIGIPDKNREGETYLPPSAGVMLFFTGFLTGSDELTANQRTMCCYSCALQVNMLLYCLLRMEKGYETTDKTVPQGGSGA